jgi:hypothetical protein
VVGLDKLAVLVALLSNQHKIAESVVLIMEIPVAIAVVAEAAVGQERQELPVVLVVLDSNLI